MQNLVTLWQNTVKIIVRGRRGRFGTCEASLYAECR